MTPSTAPAQEPSTEAGGQEIDETDTDKDGVAS